MNQVHEFKYLLYMMNNKGTKKVECQNKLMNGRRFAGAIRALVIIKRLNLTCARLLYKSLLIPTLVYERKGRKKSGKE